MKIIEVPIFNDDGSLQFTQVLGPEEAQAILQFAMNFLVTSGLAANYAIIKANADDKQADLFSAQNLQ